MRSRTVYLTFIRFFIFTDWLDLAQVVQMYKLQSVIFEAFVLQFFHFEIVLESNMQQGTDIFESILDDSFDESHLQFCHAKQ